MLPHRLLGRLGPVTDDQDRERFRRLPEPVRLEDAVETVDVDPPHPPTDEHEDRARMLRGVAWP